MGYAVLHMEKAPASDSGMSAHIERVIMPKNADPERTYLNRELIEFPDGVRNRTEAIQHRLETAGLQRKIGKNQVRAVRIMLSGSPEDMKRIEQAGRLNDWCSDNLDWLRKTYGAENIVSVVLHRDETTPHIHATMVPIVTGERRKAKEAKGKYHKKSTDTVRLCADDVMSRTKLKEYQNTYAEQVAKYGLQRGVEGSEAKHIGTSQYYRDLLNQSASVQESIGQLLGQQQQAEQELSKVKGEIKTEKLKSVAVDVTTSVVESVGSLFGNSKVKQQQQIIDVLKDENKALICKVDTLNKQINSNLTEHKESIDKSQSEKSRILAYFPYIQPLLNWENFLRKIGLSQEMVKRLFNREEIFISGELYSSEHSKRFKAEHAAVKLEQDPKQPSKIRLLINNADIFDWFRLKQQLFLNSIGIKPKEEQNRGLKR